LTSEPRRVLVCFDYEGHWGMPFASPYGLEEGTLRILDVLERYETRGTFFIVGAIALEHRDLIAEISRRGHEIAVHGWRHEPLTRLTPSQLERFTAGLDEADAVIESVTGKRPVGFRAPYLLGPSFSDPTIYELLSSRGYRWTSNRELRHVVELLRPDRIGSPRPWQLAQSRPGMLEGTAAQLVTLALNARLWSRDRVGGSMPSAIRWLKSGRPPFYRGGLLEIPVYCPMDCDLLGLPDPAQPSPQTLLDFARFALLAGLSRGPLAMLSFHDWIITGGNRLSLLEGLLSALPALGVRAVTVEESWPELMRLAGGPPGIGAREEPPSAVELTERHDSGQAPEVSVIICTRNGERRLPVTLDHVRRQSMGSERFEVIVVDDGSTDRTAEVAAENGVRVLRLEPHRGPAAARNAGLAVARGEIVAITDDDCEPAADWLAALTTSFSDPHTDGVGGLVLPTSTESFCLRYLAARNPLAPLTAELLVSNDLRYRLRLYLRSVLGPDPSLVAGAELYAVPGANMAFRREVLFELGGFDEAFTFAGEDTDLCHRAHSRAGGARLLYVPGAVVLHRFRPHLSDTLRRARAYGRGNARAAIKHPEVRFIIYPFPVLVLTAMIAAALTRRKLPATLGALVPLFAYPGWPARAWQTRSLEPLAYSYIQLAEETWTMLGELEGSRAGYTPVPSRLPGVEQAAALSSSR
jgi:glycosyltransferase involved in cell wall biosynthesis/peptidoglycan/xylan/chitin deacetylase (PgdA/CDA1 family)